MFFLCLYLSRSTTCCLRVVSNVYRCLAAGKTLRTGVLVEAVTVYLFALSRRWSCSNPSPTMNIVAEHFWEFLQKNPSLTRPPDPIKPLSDQAIMLNTMADLCIGAELLCESMEPDMGLCDNEAGGGSGTSGRKVRSGRGRKSGKGRSKGGRGGVMRSGMMRSSMMRQGMMGGGIGSAALQRGKKLSRIREESEDSAGTRTGEICVVEEKKPSTIECFAEIVSILVFAPCLGIVPSFLLSREESSNLS